MPHHIVSTIAARERPRRSAPPAVHRDAPAELRDSLRLVLASRRPLAIAWSPGWRLLPNAAFASLIGTHATDGAPVMPLHDRYPELAPWLEPLLQRAWSDGDATAADDKLFCVYRNGYAEEAYLAASCSRLTEQGESCRAVLVSITETTERVLGARRTAALRDVAAEAVGAGCVTESCVRALTALARHREEIPFALLYLRESENIVRLVAAAHVPAGGRARAESIALNQGAEQPAWPAWPVTDALSRNETVLVDDVLDRFGPLAAGGWPFAPRCALVVPVTCPG